MPAMSKSKKSTIEVQGTAITVLSQTNEDYICLTDIARYKNAEHTDDLIRNWLRNRNTVEFLGVWEQLNNPGFNPVEFDGIKMQAGLNNFTLTPKQWIEKTRAVSQYTPIVETIIATSSRDVRHIEGTLDGLLDFCGYEPALRLYKKLCRYYFHINPTATVQYVEAYREFWDSDQEAKP
jgi:hypothetical protein